MKRKEPPAERATWLAIGPRAGRALEGKLGDAARVLEVPGLHAALSHTGRAGWRGCLAEASCFEARPEAGLEVLLQRLAGAPLWLLAPPLPGAVEGAARRREIPVVTEPGAASTRWRADVLPTAATDRDGFLERLIAWQGNLDALGEAILDAFAAMTQARRAGLFLPAPAALREGRLDLVASRGLGGGPAPTPRPPRPWLPPAVSAQAHGRPQLGFFRRASGARDPYVVLPLGRPGTTVGSLVLTDLPDEALPEAGDVETWQGRAEQAAAFLRTALELAWARDSALRDAKTGLPNLRAFDAERRREHERVRRRGGAYGVAVFDIDHFKRVNTELTHPIADEVLRAVARQLRKAFREADFVCRWGGEEFTVVLTDPLPPPAADGGDPVPDVGELLLLAVERARAAIDAHGIRLPGRTEPYRVTVSGGLAVHPTDGATPEEVERQAFDAMRAAKDDGRNRVYRWPRIAPPTS